MALFSQKHRPLIGIDISSTALKLLELSYSSSKGYKVESYGVEPLPEDTVVEKLIKNHDAVAEAMHRLIKKTKPKSKDVALAVPSSAVITKTIEMDADLLEYEIENQLEVEAGQHIPYAIDEVNLDFSIIGPVEGKPDKVNVLLAASQTEVIDKLVEVSTNAGLNPVIIDVETHAMQRAFYNAFYEQLDSSITAESVIALVDIGATSTTLYVFQKGEVIYIRDQLFGGSLLTQEIQRRYGISRQEAGITKKQGGLPPDYEAEVLQPFKEGLIQQIERALQFFYSATGVKYVDRILLSGGTSSMEGLQEEVQAALEISTYIPNPFKNIAVAGRVNRARITQDHTSLSIALGLAMRSFDDE